MNGTIVDQLTLSTIIGFFAPIVIPFIFRLYERRTKEYLNKDTKRRIVTAVSTLVSLFIVGLTFEGDGLSRGEASRFVGYIIANLTIVKGTIQVVYEEIIKQVPIVDKALEDLGNLNRSF